MVYYIIQLGYYPTEIKKTRGILVEKYGKCDFWLNYMDKVVEKLVAQEFIQYYEK